MSYYLSINNFGLWHMVNTKEHRYVILTHRHMTDSSSAQDFRCGEEEKSQCIAYPCGESGTTCNGWTSRVIKSIPPLCITTCPVHGRGGGGTYPKLTLGESGVHTGQIASSSQG